MRETKKITTPSGVDVLIKTYLTGREINEIKLPLWSLMKVDANSLSEKGQISVKEISASILIEEEQKALSVCIMSIDGKTDDILNHVLDLRQTDYEFVVAEVNALRKGNLVVTK